MRNKYVNVIRANKQKHYELLLLNAKGNCKKLWSHIHGLTKGPKTTIPKTHCENNTIILDKNHTANRLISHLPLLQQEHKVRFLWTMFTKIPSVLKNYIKSHNKKNINFTIPKITSEFIENELNKMSVKKAAGDDDISVTLLQKCKSVILPTLCYLMNESITQGEFPQLWKMVKLTP